ncbi:glycosyltransferase family 2 protein [Morganella morganii]|uniref:glycosyltransferase family 2 protein n=1 Tax=Morganella morganii TaxID=582 RepID=UPI001897C3E9|nr:glycosyltransferase [Morganella morganii]
MNENNLVSIIVIAYNHERYILDCLKSISCQTYKNIELIVIDNKSTDNTLSLINTYANNNKKDNIHIIASKDNLGVIGGIKLGIKISSGDFITFFASDDIMIHDRIEKQVNFLINNPCVTGCFGNMLRINDNGEIYNSKLLPAVTKKEYRLDDILYKRINLYSPTQLYRKKLLLSVINEIPSDLKIEDIWMYHKLLANNCILYTLPYLFTLYRIHGTNTHSKYKMMMNEKIKILSEYRDETYYSKALNFIYLEHFSVFSSHSKLEAIKLFPKIMFNITSRYYWIGLARFIFDWRSLWGK